MRAASDRVELKKSVESDQEAKVVSASHAEDVTTIVNEYNNSQMQASDQQVVTTALSTRGARHAPLGLLHRRVASIAHCSGRCWMKVRQPVLKGRRDGS